LLDDCDVNSIINEKQMMLLKQELVYFKNIFFICK